MLVTKYLGYFRKRSYFIRRESLSMFWIYWNGDNTKTRTICKLKGAELSDMGIGPVYFSNIGEMRCGTLREVFCFWTSSLIHFVHSTQHPVLLSPCYLYSLRLTLLYAVFLREEIPKLGSRRDRVASARSALARAGYWGFLTCEFGELPFGHFNSQFDDMT